MTTVPLALSAAAAGAAAATLALVATRFRPDQRFCWLAVVLAGDGVLALAVSSPASGAEDAAPGLHPIRLLVHVVVVALLTAIVVAPRPPASRIPGARVGATVVVVAWAATLPDAVDGMVESTPLRVGLPIVWTVLAGVATALAVRDRSTGRATVGVGVALAGAAHVAEAAGGVGVLPDCLRLIAVAAVVGGMLLLARRALADLDATRDTRDEELRVAQLRLASAAERDHELRNGLAGLAGAATLLGGEARPGPGRPADRDGQAEALARIVASELGRLDDLLRMPDPTARASTPSAYAVAPVLTGQAMLRRSAGTDLELDTAPDLYAIGSPDTLSQVVVNLVDNAERHAPGSPIRIRAGRHGDRVRVVVSDRGPVGTERGPTVRGHGLGLPVCRRMLAAEGATLLVRPAEPSRPGFVVTVELPAPPPIDPPTLPTTGRSAGCVAS